MSEDYFGCTDCPEKDKRIAELEAELAMSREQTLYANDALYAMQQSRDLYVAENEKREAKLQVRDDHIDALKAELAALKERRCETCDEWDGPMHRDMGKCCYWTINSSPANPGCGETHFRDTHADGFCHRWAARAEEGGES